MRGRLNRFSARPAWLPAFAIIAALLLSACAPAHSPPTPTVPAATPLLAPAAASRAIIQGELTIFAAASLTDAFKEIGAAIEQANPGSKVTFNFAGSAALRTQLGQGARADLLATADEANMQGAQTDGSISGNTRVFARNKLVVITPALQKVEVVTPRDLARSGLKLVIGTEELPAGNYARQIFAKMSQDRSYGTDFSAKALANVVSEESNVKQIAAKVQLGEADAGIVYSTDVTAAVRSQVKVVTIPDALNVIAHYPVAAVKGATNEAGANAFVDYLLSPAGQAVLEKNGFIRTEAIP